MAPFRRGKRDAKNRSHSQIGRAVAGRQKKSASRSGKFGPSTASNPPFQVSRVDEAVHDASETSDFDASDSGSVERADDSLSLDESSNSNAGCEKPYNVLLQTLKPEAPPGEPKRKRRKTEPIGTPLLVQSGPVDTNNAIEGGEGQGAPSEDDTGVESAEEDNMEQPDFFSRHFSDHDESETAKSIQAIKDNLWVEEKTKVGGSFIATRRRPRLLLDPELSGHRKELGVLGFKFKPKFEKAAQELLSDPDDLTKQLAASVFSYQDTLFAARFSADAQKVRRLASVHALNHIFRTRDKVLKNTARLSKHDNDEEIEVRDQGFTRPKVLIIMPTRQSCFNMVDAIVALCQPEQQENKKRFQDSYTQVEDNLSADKPEDFKDLFGGNDDDMFRLGLKFTRKTVKFFSQFYSSDIILASPLGLRTVLGGDKSKKQDYDFLSSIDVVILDQSEALLMQNWEHVEYVFDHLNLQPKEAHGCDFSRVRSWYLDGQARYFRQTILLSAFNFPSLNKLYTQHMLNLDGKVKISPDYDGAIIKLGLPIKQTFSRLDFTDPTSEPDDRFNYFKSAILPDLTKESSQGLGGQQGILLFVPLYADFVRVRNHLASSSSTQHVSFGSISEYASVKEVARARSHFLTGRHSVLLYTERAHHFRRYHLKGVKRIALYGLPENPLFYLEIVGGFLGASISQATVDSRRAIVRCLFSRLDLLKLERIVGTKRCLALLREKGDTFDFI